MHSEKYEIKARDWRAPESLDRDIVRLNRIRRDNRALQLADNLTFHRSENDRISVLSQDLGRCRARLTTCSMAVNLDPARAQDTMVHVPLDALRLRADTPFVVEDLLTGARYTWRGSRNYVRLDPREEPGHVLIVQERSDGPQLAPMSTPSGTRTPSSMSSTSSRSATATATASATSRGLIDKLDYIERPRRQLPVAAAVLSVAAARRRLRHRRLPDDPPDYGTLEDFQRVPRGGPRARHPRHHRAGDEPHVRSAPVVPARAPRADGSPKRDYYVWSDDRHKYADARIIFTDTENSNWTWDPVAQAVLLAPLLQPSARPELRQPGRRSKRCIDVMRFWLDLGVDGLRLDAIPYLFEREGTNCENLPETHDVLEGDARATSTPVPDSACCSPKPTSGRATCVPYFGNGDECHMAFHFPLMPRMFMALRRRTARRSSTSCAQTPEIPTTASGPSSCATTTS